MRSMQPRKGGGSMWLDWNEKKLLSAMADSLHLATYLLVVIFWSLRPLAWMNV